MTFDNVAILRVGEFHPLVQELLAERPQLFFGTFECQLNTSNCLLRLIGSHIARQNANYCHVIGPVQICPRAVTCTVCAVPLAEPPVVRYVAAKTTCSAGSGENAALGLV